ncbi:MAG TPA: phosphatase PAP2 family protein [Flavobacteriaceae bacterium]|nr:phosphatase PAP2 family protein [Flavobacteriaceae bacterium]
MIDWLLQEDTALFLYLNNLGSPTWDGFWMFYTAKFNWIPFYAFLLYLLFKNLTRKQFILMVFLIAFMVTFTDQITNLFKMNFERLRPCHNESINQLMRIVRPGCGGRFGFFSGHASNSMAVAVFAGLMLKNKYRYAIYLLMLWSFGMAYSRVYIGVHYPLDILCGMLFGGFSGYLFYKLFIYLKAQLISKYKW